MAVIDNLEKRIDTNKNNIMEPQEIINFLKNDENVQELGKRLTQECKDTFYFRFNYKNLKFYNAILNATINNRKFQENIKNKIKKGVGGLTKTDVFLLYLQSTIEAIRQEKSYNIPTITKSNDIYTRYGGSTLLQYIRTTYNNPLYEFWKGWPKPEQRTPPKTKISYETPKKVTQLPTDIDFYTHGENNTYMPREFKKLDNWAKSNFPTEYEAERKASIKRKGYKKGIDDYVQYDLYMFSLKKYKEFIEKKHSEIIKGIYGTKEIYNEQQELSLLYFANIDAIKKEFPNIQEIIEKLTEYNKEAEEIQKKYLKKDNEETAQKKYKEYINDVEKKGVEMGIKEINESLKKEPQTPEEAVKYFENFNKIEQIQTEQEKIKKKYGESIDNYENYIRAKGDLIKKYGKNNLEKRIKTYKKYKNESEKLKISNFNISKYQEYTKKIGDSQLLKHYENLRILINSITIENGNVPKNFPIQTIKDDYNTMKSKQAETDARWKKLKDENIILYQICNIGARGLNALRSSTIGTGAKLGALVLEASHLFDHDEMIYYWEKTETGFWNLHFNMSTDQSKSVYENGNITFNRDNGPGLIAESIVNMYTLIYGGGAIKQGVIKGASKAGVTLGTKGINIAGKFGLFSSGFLQQVGPAFQEGFNAGMTGNQALLYCTLSACIQGGLELVSPNEVLLGSGKGLAKSYIKEILKSGEKESLKAVGKLFLKNVGSEIIEENLQETLQLAAGNLINMWANEQFDLGKILGTDKLDSDWNLKNFAATAIITTLTTGIVTGGAYATQSPGIGNNREQLIKYIQENSELLGDINNILDKTIQGNIKIPNTNTQELENLKTEINKTINENGISSSENQIESKNNGTKNNNEEKGDEQITDVEQIKNLGLNEEEIEYMKRVISTGITISKNDVEILLKYKLNEKQIKDLKDMIDIGIKMHADNIYNITEFTNEQKIIIKKLTSFGAEITSLSCDIDNCKKIQELTNEQIEFMGKLAKAGLKRIIQDIEKIKILDISQINGINKLLNAGVTIINSANPISDLCIVAKRIEEEQLKNIEELTKLGIVIDQMSASNIRLTEKQLINIELLVKIGLKLDGYNVMQFKDQEFTEQQYKNIERIISLGINTKWNDPEDLIKIKDIELSNQQIEIIKKIIEICDNSVKTDDISKIKDIKEEQLENILKRKKLGTEIRISKINEIKDINIELHINNTYENSYEEYNYSKEEIDLYNKYKIGRITENIQAYIQNTIQENREIGIIEILENIRSDFVTLSINDKKIIINQLSTLVNKFNTIRKYLDFKNGPYKSPKELLCAIRGIESLSSQITDDITVKQHGVGLTFFIGDEKSYQTIYDGWVTDSGKRSGGFNYRDSVVKELNRTLSVVNGKNPENNKESYAYGTIWHEGQHNRNSYFMPDKNGKPLERAKDEITALLRDGRGIFEKDKWNNTIESILTEPENEGGLYQYGLEGEDRENHKKQVRELLTYANDLISLTKNPETGITRENIISLLAITPYGQRKDLRDKIIKATNLHGKEDKNINEIQTLKQSYINRIKELAGNDELIKYLINTRNSIFLKEKINFWRTGTAKIETAIKDIEQCKSIQKIKHILNDPKYGHIRRQPNNKCGLEISAIIDEVVAGNIPITYIPTEIRPIIEKFIG